MRDYRSLVPHCSHSQPSAVPDDAERAVCEKQGARWKGRALKLELATQRDSLKVRVGRLAAASSKGVHAEPARAAKRPLVEAEPLAPRKKRALLAAAPKTAEATRAAQPPRSPQFACTVAVGGLVLPCQQGVSAQQVASQLTAAGAPAFKVVAPCPPEHLIGLQQDGCTGEVALLEFADAAEAQAAVMLLHGRTSIAGHKGPVHLWARQLGGEGSQVRRWRLIIRNVSFTATEALLRRTFSSAGFVWDLHIPKGDDGRMRGFAFVAFTSRAHAEQAIATLNGKQLAGRAVAVDWALSKKHYDAHIMLPPLSSEPVLAAGVGEDDAAEAGDELVDEAALMSHVLSSFIQAAPKESAGVLAAPATRRRVLDAAPGRERVAVLEPMTTVFAHNLPPETTTFDLQRALSSFEKSPRCRLVMDKLSGRFKGTAFLEFRSADAARAAIAQADGEAGVIVLGRRTQLALAVSKEEARSLAEGKAVGPTKGDRRNLYLAREGEILDGSASSVGVSSADMAKRRRAAEEKAEKLRNPNFSLSRTRLHLRNLPASVDDRELTALCVDAVRQRMGVRAAVTARIMRDDTRQDSSGAARSRGMAFVELGEHEHALCVLRYLNNNPMVFGKERRPIVEFAISDARAVRKHTLNVKMRSQRVATPAAAAAETRSRPSRRAG